jgi:hypothetical protein
VWPCIPYVDKKQPARRLKRLTLKKTSLHCDYPNVDNKDEIGRRKAQFSKIHFLK